MSLSEKEPEKDMREGHRQRLRQRYCVGGMRALADYEIVELLLTLIIPRIDVKPIAKRLIEKFRTLRGILDAHPEELESVKGMGETSAHMLQFIREIIPIYLSDNLESGGREITTISMLIDYFKSRIAAERNEVLEMICFDTKLKIIGDSSIRLVEGSVNSANIDVRRIIEVAIRNGASSIAIAHNHPSGDPRPSSEGLRFTTRISDACRPIGLSFIDHVIVGKGACFSFRRDGHFDCLYDEDDQQPNAQKARPAQSKRASRGAAEPRRRISLQ